MGSHRTVGRGVRRAGLVLGALVVVVAMSSCARGSGLGQAGGVQAGAPPAGIQALAHRDDAFADPSAWVCNGDTAACGATPTRTVLAVDGAPEVVTVSIPDADCFVVHPGDDQVAGPSASADQPPLPTARALAPVCRVFAPRLAQASVAESADQTRSAFDYFVDNLNQGRPFIVVSDTPEAAETGLVILEDVHDQAALDQQFVAAVMPGVALDRGSQPITFCTVLEAVGCTISAPVISSGSTGDRALADVTPGWAGACNNPADIQGRPAFLPDWMTADRPADGVDCDVLALLRTKVDSHEGLTGRDRR